MKNPLVSICIPVYNCEKYVKDCILSAINQTYENIEVLIRDDGSTDNSKNILKEFEKHDKVRVVYEKNVGLAAGRKILWKESKGEYIVYLDSDDMISTTCISDMVDFAIKYSADYVRGHYVRDEKELGKETDFFDKSIIIQSCDEMKRHLLLSDLTIDLEPFWGVLLKKTSFDVSILENVVQGEDGPSAYKFWTTKKDNVYVFYRFPAFFYRGSPYSLSYLWGNKSNEAVVDLCGQATNARDFFTDNFSLFTDEQKCRVANRVVRRYITLYCFLRNKNNNSFLVKLIKNCLKPIPNCNKGFIESLSLSLFYVPLLRRLLIIIWKIKNRHNRTQ